MPVKLGSGFTASIRLIKPERVSYKKILGDLNQHGRSGVRIKETQTTLQIDISAKDAAALRAALNSILKDISVVGASSSV